MFFVPLRWKTLAVNLVKNSVGGRLFERKMSDKATPSKLLRLDDTSVQDKERERLVWVDCEMTGLEPETCQLLEVACIVTDDQLNVVAQGPNIVIHQSDEILAAMNEWCVRQHGQSGLTQKVRDSKTSLAEAESALLEFVRQYTRPATCPLAGNSVHADKIFLTKYMPRFVAHLHYRIVDVSTVKELCRRWYPDEYQLTPVKQGTHRALDDIEESINELRFYRRVIFKSKNRIV